MVIYTSSFRPNVFANTDFQGTFAKFSINILFHLTVIR